MKHAILITADGETRRLDGRFIILSESAGDRPVLSVVEWYRDGLPDTDVVDDEGGVICDDLHDAIDAIVEAEADLNERKVQP